MVTYISLEKKWCSLFSQFLTISNQRVKCTNIAEHLCMNRLRPIIVQLCSKRMGRLVVVINVKFQRKVHKSTVKSMRSKARQC